MLTLQQPQCLSCYRPGINRDVNVSVRATVDRQHCYLDSGLCVQLFKVSYAGINSSVDVATCLTAMSVESLRQKTQTHIQTTRSAETLLPEEKKTQRVPVGRSCLANANM